MIIRKKGDVMGQTQNAGEAMHLVLASYRVPSNRHRASNNHPQLPMWVTRKRRMRVQLQPASNLQAPGTMLTAMERERSWVRTGAHNGCLTPCVFRTRLTGSSLDRWICGSLALASDHAEVTGRTEIQDPEIGVNNAANGQNPVARSCRRNT